MEVDEPFDELVEEGFEHGGTDRCAQGLRVVVDELLCNFSQESEAIQACQ